MSYRDSRPASDHDIDNLDGTIREAAYSLPKNFLRDCFRAPVTVAASVFAATIAARHVQHADLAEGVVREIARDAFRAARIFLREAGEQGGEG